MRARVEVMCSWGLVLCRAVLLQSAILRPAGNAPDVRNKAPHTKTTSNDAFQIVRRSAARAVEARNMAVDQTRVGLRGHPGLVNGRWQSPVLLLFLAVNLAHVTEHVLQAVQIFALGWPRSQALGALGLVWPWLVRSEWLHYWYALVILVGLIALRPALTGRVRAWWDVALAIQIWHHVEHALLLG